jgi:iron complex outermembrane receptor protein
VLFAIATAIARARAAEERQLGEVVVTAPPVEEGARRSPTAFATVVDTSAAPTEMETLAEALAETVGVQVRRFGGLGDFSTVSIRGFSAGQVQVYLDGVPLSRADNEVVNLSDLPLDAVERVEVYRGTTPLAFAQSGPGGVVNVITRRPGERPLTAASVSYGSFETRKADAVSSNRIGPWEYLAFGHYLGSRGDFTYTNDLGTATPADDREETRVNNDFNLGNLTARLGYRPAGPLAASLTADSFFREEGVPGVGVAQARDARLRTFRQLAHLDVDLLPASAPLEVSGGAYGLYERQNFRDRDGEIFVASDTDDRTAAGGGQLLLRGALGAHHLPGLFLATGYEHFAADDKLDPRGTPPARTRLRGTIGAEDEIVALGDRLSIVPGLRWEIFRDDFPGEPGLPVPLQTGGTTVRDFFSPRLGVRAVPLRGLTLLGNLGRYARVPNLAELFGNRGVVLGNPRLRPEVAWNWDLGGRLDVPAWGPLDRMRLEYAYFDNSIDDLIILRQVSLTLVRPDNVAAASLTGHELSARARLARRLGLLANYTRQETRDESEVPFFRGKELPGRPRDEAFFRAELTWSRAHPVPGMPRMWPGRVFYEVNVIAENFLDRANERRVSSRVLHGTGLELRLPWQRLRVALEVKNAGDDQQEDVLGFPLPGRAVFGTVSYGFGRADEEDDARP